MTWRQAFGFIVAFASAAVADGARAEALAGCEPTDKACLMKAMKAHPAKTRAFWQGALAKPVAERVGPAPEGLAEFLRLDNLVNG
ncbi:MAG TPA: hypothetical protein PLO00_02145, partial [Usitatibacteraceae bacterium]|nr:hypothetical protein [Usitatibacteraceae bacterium]